MASTRAMIAGVLDVRPDSSRRAPESPRHHREHGQPQRVASCSCRACAGTLPPRQRHQQRHRDAQQHRRQNDRQEPSRHPEVLRDDPDSMKDENRRAARDQEESRIPPEGTRRDDGKSCQGRGDGRRVHVPAEHPQRLGVVHGEPSFGRPDEPRVGGQAHHDRREQVWQPSTGSQRQGPRSGESEAPITSIARPPPAVIVNGSQLTATQMRGFSAYGASHVSR